LKLPRERLQLEANELRRRCLAGRMTAYDYLVSPIHAASWVQLKIALNDENMPSIQRIRRSTREPAPIVYEDVLFSPDEAQREFSPEDLGTSGQPVPADDTEKRNAEFEAHMQAGKAFWDHENARDDRQRHIDVARAVDGFFNQDRGRRRIRAVNWFIRRQERTALEDRFWLCLTEVADEFSRRPGAFAIDDNERAAKLDALRRWILAGKFSIVLNVHPHVPPSELGRFRFARDSAAIPELITPHLGDLWIKRRDCVAWASAHGFEKPHRLWHDAFSATRPPPKLARVDDGAMTATPQPQYPQRILLRDYWISKGGVFPPRSQPSQPENFEDFEQWRKSSEHQSEAETDQRAWHEICAEAAAGKIDVEALKVVNPIRG
jgi:hypothetical protein